MPEERLLRDPALASLLGSPPTALARLAGGRNSRVYRVDSEAGSFALKVYFRHPGDGRDRLGTEMGALTFLRDQGLACVPRPMAADSLAGLGLYEFIEGERPARPTGMDVDQAADFLVRLHELGKAPGAQGLPAASEARFSLSAVAKNIDERLQVLVERAPALSGFLAGELIPAWEQLRERCRGIPFDRELTAGERTLSPSDFGFHNALRRNGQLVFLDFEYFGWDDPAKMIADVLLHPGMDLAQELRVRFAEGVLAGFPDQPGLRERVRLAYPLFGIKWCLILLNEFLPGSLDRRQFAAPASVAERQTLQLAKTRAKLLSLRDTHDPCALPR